MKAHTVSELNGFIAECLTDLFANRLLEGEVSEFKISNGHWFFTLKDPGSKISCKLWASTAARYPVPLRVGERVRLFGSVKAWVGGGTYSFEAVRVERAGEGDLAARLEELRRRLAAEGLFAAEKKRPLPRFPRTVGIATGKDSAALADMLRILGDRYPAQVVLATCRVQGEGAAADIARAVRWLNSDPRVDVIIVGRGGGSAEDLFAFNEEAAVRAVATSRVPIVSAVGHESDQCLCDLAADLRAPTPSAAAKAVVPDAEDLARGLDVTRDRLDEAMARAVRRHRERLRALRLVHPQQRLERVRREHAALATRLHAAAQRIPRALAGRLEVAEQRLGPAAARVRERRAQQLARAEAGLGALSPLRVLDRGYAIVQTDGGVVRDAAQLAPERRVTLRFAKGRALARVETVEEAGDADG